jgi:tetratricopeptide (TPR) repeat protein
MTIRLKALLMLTVCYGLFMGEAMASRMLPPLPADCHAARAASDPATQVKLYTDCLESLEVDQALNPRLRAWQRVETRFKRGNALFALRRYAEALVDYDWFLSHSHGHVWGYHQRGLTHEILGNDAKALADFDEAIMRNGNSAFVRYDRGRFHAKHGHYAQAKEDLEKAITIAPETALYANELAWLLATCPDGKMQDGPRAVILARQAVKTERSAAYLDTLAAALARAGKFKDAVLIQQEAIALLKKSKADAEVLSELTQRLEAYLSGQPHTVSATLSGR